MVKVASHKMISCSKIFLDCSLRVCAQLTTKKKGACFPFPQKFSKNHHVIKPLILGGMAVTFRRLGGELPCVMALEDIYLWA